jgi:hypothetical protein
VENDRPVLLLTLDGIDEMTASGESVDALLGHFMDLHQKADQQEALLVVTCRARTQLDELLASQGTGGRPLREPFRIELGDFTVEEFGRVWKRWFATESVPDVAQPTDPNATLGTRSLPEGVVSALRHPVLLGCLKPLTPQDRARFLNDDAASWRLVLDAYLEWFSTKVRQRHRLDHDTTVEILRAAAAATASDGERSTYQLVAHWLTPAQQVSGLPPTLLRKVFDDAVTAGLLDVGDQRYSPSGAARIPWKWNLPRLRRHLMPSVAGAGANGDTIS